MKKNNQLELKEKGSTAIFEKTSEIQKKFRFKGTSIPSPSPGTSFVGVIDQMVPNQSMSLEEILRRFTRGEAVAVGKQPQFHESEDDLEKVSKMDLVEKEEFLNRQKQTKKRYEKQEKERKQKEEDDARAKAISKIEAEEREKRAKGSQDPGKEA